MNAASSNRACDLKRPSHKFEQHKLARKVSYREVAYKNGTLKSKTGNMFDLGCGAGVPIERSFVDNGWPATRVDFSPKC